jgi:hypothetical protein
VDERTERRRQRLDFLTRLYEKVDASVSHFVSAFDIAAALHIPAAQCTAILEYLQEKKYIHIDDHKQGIIRITAEGIDRVEAEPGA